jgi:hypothetical protein
MAEGFGTDIGGVLAAHATLEFLEQPGRHLAVPEIEGGFDAVRQLREEKFGEATYVISMCERTGVGWGNIIYCRTFADKARIAGRLGLTHFVDDRLEVLGGFNNRENLFLFQPNEQECARFSQHLHKVSRVQRWREIVAGILEK